MTGMYRNMCKIRRFEEKVSELFAAGRIPGFVHVYIGEEAVAVGACSALMKNDYITSTHRGHGHCIAKGGDLKSMMAELFGRRTGYCKGKGGSMHIADIDLGILGANGIVAAGIPIAVGAALSAKLRGSDQVALSFFGDGASNRSTFHEGINLAAVWKLPVIFLCENNLYAQTTPAWAETAVEDIADRAVAYSIPGKIVDGNDVVAVYETVEEAVKRAREGGGPTLIECKTYRWRGHWEGDPQRYRDQGEVEEWMKKCPIQRFAIHLMKKGIHTEEELKEIDDAVKNEVDEAIQFAEKSPLPDPEEALEDIYASTGRQVT
ncbi:MAG: thiamine pyrophosphate-dependent dehydrogenase E1 component subunit alpha [Candidatus Bathyarchaeota archaeon]|nr:MAG: thiamine pyrophosphate-dependent dehydrogenase E1 component subunit alpha [Candidatus Bathyarchaeota archaeon]